MSKSKSFFSLECLPLLTDSLTEGSKLFAWNTGRNGWTRKKDKGKKGHCDNETKGQRDKGTKGQNYRGTGGQWDKLSS